MSNWMIYGANGYTGRLTACLAASRGLKPVLAGRRGDEVRALADELGLESRVFALDQARDVARGLNGVFLVLHCAGPFSRTSAPMLDGCLETGCHYLDITGEIDVYADCHARDAAARRAGILVLPGAGFDVVPTDCLAAMLAERMPGARYLRLAFEAGGGPSPGTAKTSFEGLIKGGRVRRDGELVSVPLAYRRMRIPFREGAREGMTIPWGDVFTAYHSTGIPNIEVYLAVPPKVIDRVRKLNYLRWMLGIGPLRRAMMARIGRRTRGPGEKRRADSGSRIWGEVSDETGNAVRGELRTPNGYDLTADASVTIVERLMTQTPPVGFFTPSKLLGAEFVLSLEGVEVEFDTGTGNGEPGTG